MPSLAPSVPPSDVPSSVPTPCPPCPASTLVIDEITDDSACSADYMSFPISVIEHVKETDCVRFAVDQTWASPNATRTYMNFTDCDTINTRCEKREVVEFDDQIGEYRAKCVDGFATIDVFIQDTATFSVNDNVFIPDQCFPKENPPGFRCLWSFKIACDCPNPNCIFDGFCSSDRDCCSQSCVGNQCSI